MTKQKLPYELLTYREKILQHRARKTLAIKTLTGLAFIAGFITMATVAPAMVPVTTTITDPCTLTDVVCDDEEVAQVKPAYDEIRTAKVTGFNTVPEQTDDSPCIPASGKNICGRKDVVACPRNIPLGSIVEIDGLEYICEDRTNLKYNGRFDISCDKDFSCPRLVTGIKEVKIYLNK